MCYFCLFYHSSSIYTQFDLCNLISVSPPLKQRVGVQQCSVPAQHWPLDVMVVIAIVALCLFVELVEKFGGLVVQFGGPCALCEWWLRPLAAILGRRRTFLDLGAVVAGGWLLAGAVY